MTVVIGVDPHKGSHTAVAIDESEQQLAKIQVRSGPVVNLNSCSAGQPSSANALGGRVRGRAGISVGAAACWRGRASVGCPTDVGVSGADVVDDEVAKD